MPGPTLPMGKIRDVLRLRAGGMSSELMQIAGGRKTAEQVAIADKMQELGIKIRNGGSRCGNLDIDAYDAGRKGRIVRSAGRR